MLPWTRVRGILGSMDSSQGKKGKRSNVRKYCRSALLWIAVAACMGEQSCAKKVAPEPDAARLRPWRWRSKDGCLISEILCKFLVFSGIPKLSTLVGDSSSLLPRRGCDLFASPG